MKKRTIKIIVAILFGIYCIGIAYLLFSAFGFRISNREYDISMFSKEHFERMNLIPLKTIMFYIDKEGYRVLTNMTGNVLGNILMFVPMGMAVPVLCEQRINRFWKFLIFIVTIVIGIEILQFVTFTGSADVDDLILNTIGGCIGYGIVNIPFMRRWLRIN